MIWVFVSSCAVFLSLSYALGKARDRLRPSFRILVYAAVLALLLGACLYVRPGTASVVAVFLAAAIGTSALPEPGLQFWTVWLGATRPKLFGLATLSLAALFYIHVPITALLSSPGELGIHLGYLLEVHLRQALATVIVAFILYSLLPSARMKTALTLAAFGACVTCYIYAYVMPFGYPQMAGLIFEQEPASERDVVLRAAADVALVLVVSYGGLVLLPRTRVKSAIVGLLIANMVPLSWGAVRWVIEEPSDEIATHSETESNDELLAFSPDHPNVLVVFLDRFMGGYVERILNDEPALRGRLDGFMWYPKTISAGQNSVAGVHPIFGGYDYTPSEMNKRGEPLVDVSAESFNILPINFSKHGYEVNFVEPHGLGFTMNGDCSYLASSGARCAHVPQREVKRLAEERGFPLRDLSRADYADLLVLLGAMRGLPYFMKELLYTKGPWRTFLDHSAGTTFSVWAKLHSLPRITHADASRPTLNLFMNILPHEPYFLGPDCFPMRRMYEVSADELARSGFGSLFALQHYNAARCALLEVADYFDFLKSRGVYDQTQIVVVSDHGIVGSAKDPSSRARAGGTQDNFFVRTRSLLLVKERDAHGEMGISDEFLPNAEVPLIVCKTIGGCTNPYLGDRPIERAGRDDPFVVSIVPWQFSAQHQDRFRIERQFLLRNRDPYLIGNWSEMPR